MKNDLKHLTDDSRKNVFIIDDSLFHRTSCKKTELGSKVFDHTGMNYKKGFRMLTVSWSDGNTLIPVNSCLLASSKESNIIGPVKAFDKRTLAGKRRKLAQTKAPEAMLTLLDTAVSAGLSAEYVLFDSWFSNPAQITALKSRGMDVIAIARGNIEFMEVENAGVLAYTRCLDKQKLLVCCNFRDVESQMEFTQEWKSGRKILGNYEENHKNNYKVLTLRPYEIIVLEKGEE